MKFKGSNPRKINIFFNQKLFFIPTFYEKTTDIKMKRCTVPNEGKLQT